MEQCRENEAAIVTGASSGIGAAISARLCKMGYEVFGIGRSFGRSFAEQFPDAADNPLFHAVVCDLLDTEKMLKLVRGIAAEVTVTLLVNNAGSAYYGLHEELSPKKIQEMVRTDLEVPMILSQQLLRGFKKNKGYGTKAHIDAIKEKGICPIHRKTFTKNFSAEEERN